MSQNGKPITDILSKKNIQHGTRRNTKSRLDQKQCAQDVTLGTWGYKGKERQGLDEEGWQEMRLGYWQCAGSLGEWRGGATRSKGEASQGDPKKKCN